MAGIAERVFGLIKQAVEEQNVELWDVKFVKEGASYYLRVFIDKPEGININDCTAVSHAIDPIIDEADPIDKSYYLEVCSPGLERELVRPEHFERFIGSQVRVGLYKAVNGEKELTGALMSADGLITIKTQENTVQFDKKEVTFVKLLDL